MLLCLSNSHTGTGSAIATAAAAQHTATNPATWDLTSHTCAETPYRNRVQTKVIYNIIYFKIYTRVFAGIQTHELCAAYTRDLMEFSVVPHLRFNLFSDVSLKVVHEKWKRKQMRALFCKGRHMKFTFCVQHVFNMRKKHMCSVCFWNVFVWIQCETQDNM